MSQNTYNYMSEMLSVLCRAAAERMILGPCQCSVEDKHWMSLDKKQNKTKLTRISVLSSKGHYMEERRRYRHEVMGKKDIVFLSAESAKGITL